MLSCMDSLQGFRRVLTALPRGALKHVEEQTGLALSYLTSLRRGKTEPGMARFVMIAKALGMRPDELLDLGEPDPKMKAVIQQLRDAEHDLISRRLRKLHAQADALGVRVASGRRGRQ